MINLFYKTTISELTLTLWKHIIAQQKRKHNPAFYEKLRFLLYKNKKPPIYVLVETVGVEPTSRHNGT
jgi:hypothetical protein